MAAEHRNPAEDKLLGTVIGRYRIKRVLDQGGMGALYLAEHMLIGKPVVIKLLRPDLSHHADIVARFFNEAKAAAAIRHPGVIEIFDFGYHADGRGYLVMEHLDGHSLAHRLRLRGRLTEVEAATIARSIASVLAAAHACGIVHRDLKPDNIFLVPDPDALGGERVKVLDFGIAKLEDGDASKTRTGTIMGTPLYMSPEQARGAGTVDARADLYSLGCLLYHMLAGRPPFDAGGSGELIAMHLYSEPQPLRELAPELSDAIERVTMSLLVKDPEQRMQTARELSDELGAITGAAPQPVLLGPPIVEPERVVEIVAEPPPVEEWVRAPVRVPIHVRTGATTAGMEPFADSKTDSWFRSGRTPSPTPIYESMPPIAAPRTRWIAPLIGAAAAIAMVTFGIVRSVSSDDDDALPTQAPSSLSEPAVPIAPAAAAATPAVAEPAAEPPAPAVAEPETPQPPSTPSTDEPAAIAPEATKPVVTEIAPSHPHAVANRKPPSHPANHAPPPTTTTTSSPNGSPLEPDL